MPAPDPLWSGGRLFMIPARLGEANIPIATPLSKSSSANQIYEKLIGRNVKSMKLIAAAAIPPVAKGLAPYRSERIPDKGPAIRKPTVKGTM